MTLWRTTVVRIVESEVVPCKRRQDLDIFWCIVTSAQANGIEQQSESSL